MNKESLANTVDYTMLKAESTQEQIINLCNDAIENKFASVCVNPCNVKLAKSVLNDSGISVCTVIGFPLGANTCKIKSLEAKEAIENGASEIDMVINIGRLKDGDYDYVKKDIEEVVKVSNGKALVKVIIETCLLNDDEKVIACKIAKEAGADFVKTSTGFSIGGANVEDIKIMKKTVGSDIGIKASGGIRNYEDAVKLIEAGATRIGSSKIIKN